jgi:hypothetical protein
MMMHGDAKMRRGVASMAQKCVECWRIRPPAKHHPGLGCLPPLLAGAHDGPGRSRPCSGWAHAAPLPTRPARSAGRRRHRFPRSHGPAEHKVKTQWLTLRCPANSLSSATWAPSHPRSPSKVEMPKEPESRSNPGEFALWRDSPAPRACSAGPDPPFGGRQTEGTREPQESRRIRDGGGTNETAELVGRRRQDAGAPIAICRGFGARAPLAQHLGSAGHQWCDRRQPVVNQRSDRARRSSLEKPNDPKRRRIPGQSGMVAGQMNPR